jgi:methionyl-tRNA synthetase
MDKFYVTTPIYYVNDVPHIGHAYTTIAADILARFIRLIGGEVFFLTGTDEHGQKVEKAALERNLTPKQHADLMVENFKTLWVRLNISNDAFIRTTDDQHKSVVQNLLETLHQKGEIVKRPYEGWYCTPDERFWTEKELSEGNCPECGRPVESIEEENYFFLMSKYQEPLMRYIEEHPLYILPEARRNEVMGFLKSKELADLCISRPKKRLSWGVPLPFDDDYVTYVWLDALINYYSATIYLVPPVQAGESGKWPAEHHIVGKDILTTHAVYWSTMLMALGMPLPRNIFAHGWWTVEGKKMSKSLGNVVDPSQVVRDFGVDSFRYFLFREVPFGLDGDFSVKALMGRMNSDLANDLGNLVSRTLTMAGRYFGGRIPEPESVETEMQELAEGILEKVLGHLKVLAYHKALDEIWSLVSFINKYIDTNQPWALAKSPEMHGRLSTVIYSSLEGLRFLALYLCPFIPDSAEKIYGTLGIVRSMRETTMKDFSWGGLVPGAGLEKAEPLFPRMETGVSEKREKRAEKEQKKEQKKEKGVPHAPPVQSLISIEDFANVDLRVGRVLEAERVKGSQKLIKLKVDIGEIRQIIAGIGKVYSPDDLIGKNIVVVANLKPSKLMGVESQGMLLAAGKEDSLALIEPSGEIEAGMRVM